MCLYPQLLPNPKYKPNKKNGGDIPYLWDERLKYVPIGCKVCIECKKQLARDWLIRLLEEVRHDDQATFVTLTFNDKSYKNLLYKVNKDVRKANKKLKTKIKIEGYDQDNYIAAKAVRLFLERWRSKTEKSIKHWLITELGHTGTERIHLHGLIWSKDHQMISNTWKYGFVYCGYSCNEYVVRYMVKYVHKTDQDHKYYIPKLFNSAGIGAGYMKRTDYKRNLYHHLGTDETYQTRTGNRIALPIYYRNKIYTEDEREMLWLEKLDKQERWVLGQRIDISQDEDEYWERIKYSRITNKKLGYADNAVNWNEKAYKEARKKLKLMAKHEKQ